MSVRRAELVRGGWGLACLAAPDLVVSRLGDGRTDSRARWVCRVLGARQLTQAVLSGLPPSAQVVAVGVWVDSVHSLTAAGLALVDRSRWRPALLDVAVAAAFAELGRRDVRDGRRPGSSWQDRAAQALLPFLPGAISTMSLAQTSRAVGERQS